MLVAELELDRAAGAAGGVRDLRRPVLPDGLRVYDVVVDLGGGTLTATFLDVGGGLPFAEAKPVLGRMAETLEPS